jgi:hypothetical protein
VLAVYWYCRARCWVLHSLYWGVETVVLRPVGEAHLCRRFSVSELLCLHHPDIPSCVQETQGTPVRVMLHRTFRCLHFSQATEARERRTDITVI